MSQKFLSSYYFIQSPVIKFFQFKETRSLIMTEGAHITLHELLLKSYTDLN
jgi:hypothetical protein